MRSAKTRAAIRRAMPPFDGVAFDDIDARACSRICARARSGAREDQRDHVLQLVAIARRARALRRAGAAPKPRGQQLIGQPVIDQAIEVGPIGLDAQHRELVRSRRRRALVQRGAGA